MWQTSSSSSSISTLYNDTKIKSLGLHLSSQQSKYGFKLIRSDRQTHHQTISSDHPTGLRVWQTSSSSSPMSTLYNDTNLKSLGLHLSSQQSKYGFKLIRSDRQTHHPTISSDHPTGLRVWQTSSSSSPMSTLYNDTDLKSLGLHLSSQQSKYVFLINSVWRSDHPTIRPVWRSDKHKFHQVSSFLFTTTPIWSL